MEIIMNKSEILEKIIEKKGDCLDYKNCKSCPFKLRCFTSVFSKDGLFSKNERMFMALDLIVDEELFDEIQ